MFEATVDPDRGIYADVSLTIDTTNTSDVNASVTDFEAAVSDQWEVDSEPVFITSVPTISPSLIPSLSPTTLLPSASPSMTGLVVTIDVTKIFLKKLNTRNLFKHTSQ